MVYCIEYSEAILTTWTATWLCTELSLQGAACKKLSSLDLGYHREVELRAVTCSCIVLLLTTFCYSLRAGTPCPFCPGYQLVLVDVARSNATWKCKPLSWDTFSTGKKNKKKSEMLVLNRICILTLR